MYYSLPSLQELARAQIWADTGKSSDLCRHWQELRSVQALARAYISSDTGKSSYLCRHWQELRSVQALAGARIWVDTGKSSYMDRHWQQLTSQQTLEPASVKTLARAQMYRVNSQIKVFTVNNNHGIHFSISLLNYSSSIGHSQDNKTRKMPQLFITCHFISVTSQKELF